jgi:hypothetical protein
MPKTTRLDAPGVLHHVMIRGIAGVGFSAERGESIAKEGNYSLESQAIKFLKSVPAICLCWRASWGYRFRL